MTMITEGSRPGDYLLSEGNGAISRESVVVTGAKLTPGTVLGQVTVGGKFVALNPAADATGAEVAAAVLYDHVDAATADADGVITARLAEVDDAALTWPAGITAEQKAAAVASLAARHIIVR